MSISKSIEFLQNKDGRGASRSIKERLESSLDQCSAFRGSVAFWTVATNYLKALKNALQAEHSFICVDIHKPTDIDCLAKFVSDSATNIYLFLYRKEKDIKMPLLHTKLLLLDFDDDRAEIWVGSQNMTSSAIAGFNLESTMVIPTSKNSELYVQVNSYLHYIKKCCEDVAEYYSKTGKKFNSQSVNYYKSLQQPDYERKYVVIDILCNDIKEVHNLSKKEEGGYILISAYQDENYIKAKQDIVIRALDKNKQVVLYTARVNVKGDITPADTETTYTDGNDKRYHVNGFITQLKGGVDSENLIPIFSKEKTDISGYSTFIIIEFMEEFKEQLRPLNNKLLWKTISVNSNTRSSLAYLHSVPENEKIQVPISFKDYETQVADKYPFKKLFESKQLAQDIDSLYQLLENTKNDPRPTPKRGASYLENARLEGKRTFARELTNSSYLEDAFIDNNNNSEKTILSHNEQVEMFPKI